MKNKEFWLELLCVLGITAVFIFAGFMSMFLERDVTFLVFASLFFVTPLMSAFCCKWFGKENEHE